jgi:hypothetical protein
MVGGTTLKTRTLLPTLAATLLVTAPIGSAYGNQLPGAIVSGHVVAVDGHRSINIDGKTYRIKSGSPAAGAARAVAAGQLVDAQLNGPANSSATEVVNIVTRTTR